MLDIKLFESDKLSVSYAFAYNLNASSLFSLIFTCLSLLTNNFSKFNGLSFNLIVNLVTNFIKMNLRRVPMTNALRLYFMKMLIIYMCKYETFVWNK